MIVRGLGFGSLAATKVFETIMGFIIILNLYLIMREVDLQCRDNRAYKVEGTHPCFI